MIELFETELLLGRSPKKLEYHSYQAIDYPLFSEKILHFLDYLATSHPLLLSNLGKQLRYKTNCQMYRGSLDSRFLLSFGQQIIEISYWNLLNVTPFISSQEFELFPFLFLLHLMQPVHLQQIWL